MLHGLDVVETETPTVPVEDTAGPLERNDGRFWLAKADRIATVRE